MHNNSSLSSRGLHWLGRAAALLLLALAWPAAAQNMSFANFPHRATTVEDALGNILGRGKDWFDYPTFTLSSELVLQNDFVTAQGVANSNNLSANLANFYSLGLAPRLALQGTLSLEQINAPNPGDHFFLKGEGGALDETYLVYTDDLFKFQAGKFGQDFGVGWNLAPGLYGNSFASDYATDGRLGIRASYDIGREIIGTHTVSASLFTQDNTVFSDSIFTRRGRSDVSQGGPSNTDRLDSYSIALTGMDVPIFSRPIFNYQLAFRSQAPGVDGNATEHGESAAIWLPIPLDSSVATTARGHYQSINPLVEYVHLDNADGIAGQHRDYVTGAVDWFFGDWDWSVAGTARSSDTVADGSQHDWMLTTSVGKQIPGWNASISLGYMYAKTAGQYSNTVGLMFTIDRDWLANFQPRRGW